MKAMENKQKAIEKAYGEHYIKCNPDENGWSSLDNTEFYPEIEFSIKNHYHWRPKSLQGIENNNRWIKIESEADLPKELIFYNACNKHNDFEDVPMFYGLNLSKLENYYKSKIITHYQPIQKPKPPIY